MLENHSHPVLRNRQIPVKKSTLSIIAVPVDEPEPEPKSQVPQAAILTPEPVAPVVVPTPVTVPEPSIDIGRYITCVIVNFKTRKLTKQALTSFLDVYPNVPVDLIDNGSGDDSTSFIKQAEKVYPKVISTLYDENIGHGPAMHRAITGAETKYVFTLDSDCVIDRGGFLQRMLDIAQTGALYAVGWRRWVDRFTGVATKEQSIENPNKDHFVGYIHPCAALYNREMYVQLPPFDHYGAPCIVNMVEADRRRFMVHSFPIFQYITHLKAGTRRMYGGRWNPKEEEKPKAWTEDNDWPI